MSNNDRKTDSPEAVFQKHFQRVEKALVALGKTRGRFDPLVIEAAREKLHTRVEDNLAKLDTTDQTTIFESLEARAAEMRDHRDSNFTRSIPPAMLVDEDLPDLHITICRALMEALHNQPPADPFVVADLFSSTSLPAAASDRFCVAFYGLLPQLDNIVRAKGGNPVTYIKLANAPEPEKPRSSSLASPPEPEP